MAKSGKPYDTRVEAAPGESRTGHFTAEVQVHQATFAAALKSHRHQNDDTTFPSFTEDDD